MSEPSFVTLQDNAYYLLQCPHCHEYVYVQKNELNCLIFRHGVHKSNFQPIYPHTSKEECDRLVQQQQIYGCGKPFEIILLPNQQMVVQICDYK